MDEEEKRKVVREGYAKIVEVSSSCCGSPSPCCGGTDLAQEVSRKMGYTEEDLKAVPEGANLGLGCGNPVALASLREGETVLDLGSGAGFDCFLAASKVGQNGRAIGVDMTPEMIARARDNARRSSYGNVEFRLGEIENLPVADNFVDAVISNCVINLMPDKRRGFRETFRVLRPGGRLMISDIVLLKELPDAIKESIEAYVGCVAGAVMKDEYLEAIRAAGFQDVEVIEEAHFPVELIVGDPTTQTVIGGLGLSGEEVKEAASSVVSIKVQGIKPG
jgi:arsenite methyltransferase